MMDATLTLDGISIIIQIDKWGNVEICFPTLSTESVYFSPQSIRCIIAVLETALHETKEKSE